MERKASDILSDPRKIGVQCLSNLIVLIMCLWSPLPFRHYCKKVRNQRCTTFTMSNSNLPQTETKATGHHFKYVRPKSKDTGHFVRSIADRYFKAWVKSVRVCDISELSSVSSISVCFMILKFSKPKVRFPSYGQAKFSALSSPEYMTPHICTMTTSC